MNVAQSIRAETLGAAWERSLALFSKGEILNRFDSRRGPCVEVEDLTIQVDTPLSSPQASEVYPAMFRPFIEVYADGFFGQNETEASTIAQRLYRWPRRQKGVLDRQPEGKYLDQLAQTKKLLIEQPESRYNIVGFWDPDIDTEIDTPVSPLTASFRVRGGVLHSTLCARSIDAWLGGPPAMIGFTRLHAHLAKECNLKVGFVTFFFLSYHIYEMDLPVVPGIFVP